MVSHKTEIKGYGYLKAGLDEYLLPGSLMLLSAGSRA